MSIEQPSLRPAIQETLNGVQVILPSKKTVFGLIWFALWLLVWGYMTGHVIYLWAIITGGGMGLINGTPSINLLTMGMLCVFPFLAILLSMGVIAIYSFLWHIAGKEIIEVNSKSLIITRQIFKWKRQKEYSSKIIRNLGLYDKKPNSIDTIRGIQRNLGKDGIIAFDYGAKTFRFGLEIDDAEAMKIISVIQKHLPQ